MDVEIQCIICPGLFYADVYYVYSIQIEKNKKYAKWKAAYIHKCLQTGETPVAGPLPEEGDEGKY